MDPIEGQWSPEEDEMLINLILEYGFRCWSLIGNSIPAKSVETCLSRYLSLLDKDRLMDHTAGRWSTPEEDEMLKNLILNHDSNWSLISNSIPGKSVETCLSRLFSLFGKDGVMDQAAGRWSPEEDEMLFNLVEKHGHNWSPISKSIPGKSPAKCWSRWRSLAKNDTDQIERQWSSEEDEMLLNLVVKHGHNWSLISKSLPGRSAKICELRWKSSSKTNEDITIGGQGSSYIHHGNLSHEVGGVSHQPPSISDFFRGNMSSGGTHSFSRDKSAPSWNALNIRESSLMMIKGHDDVQELAGGDFGLKDSSEVSSTSIVQEKGQNKES